ncbi:hypothetical protein K470DRAFT_261060 [Piedraia hortae CBS 480.64]|uniref:Uncharacterized protein n=1 Tax=Piedraia hortae CBS 480.64 TaxID=1314780 RepID=A0A6A7BP54_9PEZI|nr:hypothetical protein K470DRAFT_261060 [Piedraia hortae CBS 480.64]
MALCIMIHQTYRHAATYGLWTANSSAWKVRVYQRSVLEVVIGILGLPNAVLLTVDGMDGP